MTQHGKILTERRRSRPSRSGVPAVVTHRLYSAPRKRFSGFLQTLHSAAETQKAQHWWVKRRTKSTLSWFGSEKAFHKDTDSHWTERNPSLIQLEFLQKKRTEKLFYVWKTYNKVGKKQVRFMNLMKCWWRIIKFGRAIIQIMFQMKKTISREHPKTSI